MAKIGLVVREGVEGAVVLARALLTWAAERKHEVLVEEHIAPVLGHKGRAWSARELAVLANPIVTLGGDGTLIGVARYVREPSPIIIGVNFGNLGFLTEITPADLFSTLEEFFAGKVLYGTRDMIRAEIRRRGDVIFSSQAVNDAVVQKGTRDPLVELDLFVDGDPVMRVRADGLIVSTPTGSTAYSLAAGGSIVYPHLSAVLVTPICAHSLTSRPLILPLDAEIEVKIPRYEGHVYLTVDGQVSLRLESGDIAHITRATNTVKFVRSSRMTYFDILRRKLNWGIPNQPGNQ